MLAIVVESRISLGFEPGSLSQNILLVMHDDWRSLSRGDLRRSQRHDKCINTICVFGYVYLEMSLCGFVLQAWVPCAFMSDDHHAWILPQHMLPKYYAINVRESARSSYHIHNLSHRVGVKKKRDSMLCTSKYSMLENFLWSLEINLPIQLFWVQFENTKTQPKIEKLSKVNSHDVTRCDNMDVIRWEGSFCLGLRFV